MFTFGARSQSNLNTVTPGLQRVMIRTLGYGIMDLVVIEGRRSWDEQSFYYASGKSKVKWPNSKHNVLHPNDLARAVDVAPYINNKVSWDKDHCCVMAGLILAAAKEEGVKIRWGGNWDCDGEPITDQSFQDLVHFEEIT